MRSPDLARYGIEIPETYLKMLRRGLLRYGRDRADWKKNWKKIMLETPPALATCDLEWLPLDEIAARAERYGGRPRWRQDWPESFVFLAFAHTGAGDEWGWALAAKAAEPLVVYIEHDSDDARIVAPTFAGFVFRMAMSALAHCSHEPKEMSLQHRIEMLLKSTSRILTYLTKEQRDALKRAASPPVNVVTTQTMGEKSGRWVRGGAQHIHLSFMEQARLDVLVQKTLSYDRLDEAIRF